MLVYVINNVDGSGLSLAWSSLIGQSQVFESDSTT